MSSNVFSSTSLPANKPARLLARKFRGLARRSRKVGLDGFSVNNDQFRYDNDIGISYHGPVGLLMIVGFNKPWRELMLRGRLPVWLSLLLIAGCAMVPSQTMEQTEPREKVLDNGLKVLVKPDHRAPVVVSQVWYKVGSSYEPKGLTGISHVLEHMMFKGTENLKPNEFSRIIADNGGRENAFTGRDYTS